MDKEIWRSWSVGALSGEVNEGTFLFDLVETFASIEDSPITPSLHDEASTPNSRGSRGNSRRGWIDKNSTTMKKVVRIERSNLQVVLHIMAKEPDERSIGDIDTLSNILSPLSFFAQFKKNEAQVLLKYFESLFFPRGTKIFEQGSEADAFYVILKGSVKLVFEKKVSDEAEEASSPELKKNVLSMLSTGESFGDFTSDQPLRNVTAITAADTHALSVPKQHYFEFVKGVGIQDAVQRSQWLRSIQDICSKGPMARREVELHLILASLKSVAFFSSLSPHMKVNLCRHLGYVQYGENETIFSVGDAADLFYVILSGSVEIILPSGVCAKVLGNNESFGEVALINNSNRAATVRTKVSTSLLTLSKKAYTKVLQAAHSRMVEKSVDWLYSVFEVFKGESKKNLMNVATYFDLERYLGGENPIPPDTPLTKLYFVITGEIVGSISAEFVKKQNTERPLSNPPVEEDLKTFEMFTVRTGGCLGILEDLAVSSKYTSHYFTYRVASTSCEMASIPIKVFHSKDVPVAIRNDYYTSAVVRSENLAAKWRQIVSEEGLRGWSLKTPIKLPLVVAAQIGSRADGTYQPEEEEIKASATEDIESIERLGKKMLVRARKESQAAAKSLVSVVKVAKAFGKIRHRRVSLEDNSPITLAKILSARKENEEAVMPTALRLARVSPPPVAITQDAPRFAKRNSPSSASSYLSQTRNTVAIPPAQTRNYVVPQLSWHKPQPSSANAEEWLRAETERVREVRREFLLPTLTPRLHESWGTRVGQYQRTVVVPMPPPPPLIRFLDEEPEEQLRRKPAPKRYVLSSVTGKRIPTISHAMSHFTTSKSKLGQQMEQIAARMHL